MPQFEEPSFGDLFVQLRIVTPKHLSPTQAEALAGYTAASEPDSNTNHL